MAGTGSTGESACVNVCQCLWVVVGWVGWWVRFCIGLALGALVRARATVAKRRADRDDDMLLISR